MGRTLDVLISTLRFAAPIPTDGSSVPSSFLPSILPPWNVWEVRR